MRYYLRPAVMPIMKKDITGVGEDVNKREHLYTLGRSTAKF